MSEDPVHPNQREHVELEIVNQSPDKAVVDNDDQIQHGSSSADASASNEREVGLKERYIT